MVLHYAYTIRTSSDKADNHTPPPHAERDRFSPGGLNAAVNNPQAHSLTTNASDFRRVKDPDNPDSAM